VAVAAIEPGGSYGTGGSSWDGWAVEVVAIEGSSSRGSISYGGSSRGNISHRSSSRGNIRHSNSSRGRICTAAAVEAASAMVAAVLVEEVPVEAAAVEAAPVVAAWQQWRWGSATGVRDCCRKSSINHGQVIATLTSKNVKWHSRGMVVAWATAVAAQRCPLQGTIRGENMKIDKEKATNARVLQARMVVQCSDSCCK